MRKTKLIALLPLIAALVLFSGCSGYRLGTTLPADIQSVYVPTFVNETSEPTIEIVATQQTIRELQSDGTLKVLKKSDADTLLEVTVTGFTMTPILYDTDDTKRANGYRMTLRAKVRFSRASTGETLTEEIVEGYHNFGVSGGDVGSAKQRNYANAARNLAKNIVTSLIAYW